jgi:hypothetical protein
VDVVVRAAREEDLARADALLRAAFDAFTGRSDHLRDGDPLRSRWRTGPERVVVAELDGRVVGSNVITVRGRTGWFGPLSVDPQLGGAASRTRWLTKPPTSCAAEGRSRRACSPSPTARCTCPSTRGTATGLEP